MSASLLSAILSSLELRGSFGSFCDVVLLFHQFEEPGVRMKGQFTYVVGQDIGPS